MTTTIKPRTLVITAIRGSGTTGVDMGRLLGPIGPQVTVAGTPRKRQRLAHLNQDERLMRRKLKNRVAAQTARDRKREKMSDMERDLCDMQEQNELLQRENEELRRRTSMLSTENSSLRSTLGLGEAMDVSDVKVESVQVPTESAAFSLCSQQKDRAPRPTPNMASATCLSLILTLSLVSSLSSKIASVRQSSQRRTHPSGKVQKARPAQRRVSKWWGPQQQSWNPSGNL